MQYPLVQIVLILSAISIARSSKLEECQRLLKNLKPFTDKIEEKIGQLGYQIGDYLGSGCFGSVFAATKKANGIEQSFAIKILVESPLKPEEHFKICQKYDLLEELGTTNPDKKCETSG